MSEINNQNQQKFPKFLSILSSGNSNLLYFVEFLAKFSQKYFAYLTEQTRYHTLKYDPNFNTHAHWDCRRHGTQHNDTQSNDIQHNNKYNVTLTLQQPNNNIFFGELHLSLHK
jgi:hypothetical protein